MTWQIHKFGGSSLANSDKLSKVIQIAKTFGKEKSLVVVSAMGGVTDRLAEVIKLSSTNASEAKSKMEGIRDHFHKTASELLSKDQVDAYKKVLDEDFSNLESILKSIAVVNNCSEQNHDYIIGMGEVWTAQLVSLLAQNQGLDCDWIDARKVVLLNSKNDVDYQASQKNLLEIINANPKPLYIFTGFVAKKSDGSIAILGRNGSDYSASLTGNFLDGSSITIWTDVAGVMSGDPRKVPEAQVLDELSYQEATELAYFGAKVVHLKTMLPALEKNIPLWIKSTFEPELPGTKICSQEEHEVAKGVTGFSTIGKLALINVEGRGMIGVPGIAERLFASMNRNGISVILISQASSEFSICFAIPDEDSHKAKTFAEEEFHRELAKGMIENIHIEHHCCILAAVGDGMVGSIGVSAKLFSALGKAGVNIRAIAQGSSERNISVVIKEDDSTKALRAAHSAFYLSAQTISVGLIGPGGVGRTLLDQFEDKVKSLKEEFNVDIRVRGITNSRKMLLDEKKLPLDNWRDDLENKGQDTNLESFVDHIQTDFIPHTMLIDCTTSEDVAKQYKHWLERGIHIATPNKKAPTFSMQEYRELKSLGKKSSGHLLYETTVGAGLPIIGTLKELIQTGDKVQKVEGVLSGTLAYLFYHFDGTRPFSEIVREAKEKGYTEPDPRDDLSGMDIVRKVVILAREIGLEIETSDVKVEGLVPKELEDCSIDEFLDGLAKYDDDIKDKLKKANANNQVLRYVGVIDSDGKCEVRLTTYGKDHPFSRIKATDNIVAFTTKRYEEQPLIVQGPGAGLDVTAAGVFAEVLRLARYLGNTL